MFISNEEKMAIVEDIVILKEQIENQQYHYPVKLRSAAYWRDWYGCTPESKDSEGVYLKDHVKKIEHKIDLLFKHLGVEYKEKGSDNPEPKEDTIVKIKGKKEKGSYKEDK